MQRIWVMNGMMWSGDDEVYWGNEIENDGCDHTVSTQMRNEDAQRRVEPKKRTLRFVNYKKKTNLQEWEELKILTKFC